MLPTCSALGVPGWVIAVLLFLPLLPGVCNVGFSSPFV